MLATTNLVVPIYHLHVSCDVSVTAFGAMTEAYSLNLVICEEPWYILAAVGAAIGITVGPGVELHSSVSWVAVGSCVRFMSTGAVWCGMLRLSGL